MENLNKNKSGGHTLVKKGETPVKQKSDETKPVNKINLPPNNLAASPYNFVPLNDIIVFPKEQIVTFNEYNTARNSGYIDLDIENKTPIFIRGNNENFLLINEKPIIPGSSLRGLIRNMVGILSFSKIDFINDSRFFFRSFADAANRLRNEYNEEIIKDSKVGILFETEDRNYILVPSVLLGTIPDITIVNDCIYDPATNIWKLYSGSMPGTPETKKSHNYEIEGRKITDSGSIPINWDSEIIKEYKEDVNRKKGFNVLENVKKYHAYGMPIFYQTDVDGNLTSFGNTKNYRLPYHETVRNHLFDCHNQIKLKRDKNNQTFEKLDFVSLIFGKTNENSKVERSIATRVYFEDAICENPSYLNTCVLKILSSPKPTSFQLYLKQPKGIDTKKEQLQHWNDANAKIRGFKQYWHKINDAGYKAADGTKKPSDSFPDPVKPLGANNIFKGRIRFENLTNKELGGLLYALDLPKDHCHKIGMGKPLGLGSIHISPKLVLGDRKMRYSFLLNTDGNWNLPGKRVSSALIAEYKKSFSEYVLSNIDPEQKDLWNIDRISQLKSMLEYDENRIITLDWLNETRYMEIERKKDDNGDLYTNDSGKPKAFNEYKNRAVLDTPKNILDKFKK